LKNRLTQGAGIRQTIEPEEETGTSRALKKELRDQPEYFTSFGLPVP
jgi:hypothetical protein